MSVIPLTSGRKLNITQVNDVTVYCNDRKLSHDNVIKQRVLPKNGERKLGKVEIKNVVHDSELIR